MYKKILIVLFFVLWALPAFALDTLWTRIYGGSADDAAFSVQQTQDGGYIVTGYTKSFGAGGSDVWLIKTNATGDTIWTRTYGEADDNWHGNFVQQTEDGGFIVAGGTDFPYPGDVLLIKSDLMGNLEWARIYDGGGPSGWDEAYCVQQTQDGGYIAVGYTLPDVNCDSIWVLKTDADGDTSCEDCWSRLYKIGSCLNEGFSILETRDGGYIVGGVCDYWACLMKISSSGDPLWTRLHGLLDFSETLSVKETKDGGFIVGGWTLDNDLPDDSDVYLVKTDSSGEELWSKTYGGSGWDVCWSVQQTTDGGYIGTGSTESFGIGSYDIWLIRTDENGDTLWTRTFGGSGWDDGCSVQQTTDGGFIIAGHTESFGAGGKDIWLLKVARARAKYICLVYMNGDNNLESAAIDDINEMEMVGSSEDVEIIVQVDRIPGFDATNGDWTDTRRYHITSDADPDIINSTRLDAASPLGELNMGDPQTLVDFINWGIDNYPADHYAVVVWDHGSGWYKKPGGEGYYKDDVLFKGVSWDDTDGDNIGVSDGDWESAISAIRSHLGRNIDLYGFDACLMQMWEVLDITDEYADYLVGSEEVENFDGWNYNQFLLALIADPTMSPEELGEEIVDAAVDGDNEDTQSCVDLSQIPALTTAVNDFACELLAAIGDPDDETTINSIRTQLTTLGHEFDTESHIDLYELCESINSETTLPSDLRTAANGVMTAVDNAVTWNRVQPDYSWANGIAIYYPADPSDYDDRYDDLPVASNTYWENFISQIPDLSFRPNPDGWQFANWQANMWPESWWQQFDYCQYPYPAGWCLTCSPSDFPDWPLFVSAFGEDQCYWNPPPGLVIYKVRAVLYWHAIKGSWGGSCFGFATSSFLFFDDYLDVNSEFGYPQVYSVPINDDSRLMINKYWVYQLGAIQVAYIVLNKLLTTPNQTLQACEEMLNSCTRNDRILVMFNNNGSGGHAVNPYRCEVDPGNPDITDVYVYDNNYPGQDGWKVSINTNSNTWSYAGQPGWGGSMNLFLMDPVSNYTTNPIMPVSTISGDSGISQMLKMDSEYVKLYFSSTDTVLFESPSGSIGHMGDSLFSTLTDGMPIIPITGQETPPIGYYLPNDAWTCQFSGITDSTFRLSLFTDSTVIVYWRSDVDSTQKENLRYPGNDSTLLILNPDNESRLYHLDAISAAPDSEIYYSIEDISIDQGDSTRYSLKPESELQLDNHGGIKTYDLRLEIAGINGDAVFFHEDIGLSNNTSHLIVPDWRPYNDSLMILVDSGMVGSFSDTIFVENEAFICGDANADGVIELGDVVYLINYVYRNGDPPIPMEAGDCNCDGIVELGDIVYLINYLFKGGPPPEC